MNETLRKILALRAAIKDLCELDARSGRSSGPSLHAWMALGEVVDDLLINVPFAPECGEIIDAKKAGNETETRSTNQALEQVAR